MTRVSLKELKGTVARVFILDGMPEAVAAAAAAVVARAEMLGSPGLRMLCLEPGTERRRWHRPIVRPTVDGGLVVEEAQSLLWHAVVLPTALEHLATTDGSHTLVLGHVHDVHWVLPIAAGLAGEGLEGVAEITTLRGEPARSITFASAAVTADSSVEPSGPHDVSLRPFHRPRSSDLDGGSPVRCELARLSAATAAAVSSGLAVDRDLWRQVCVRADAMLVPTSARSRLGAG